MTRAHASLRITGRHSDQERRRGPWPDDPPGNLLFYEGDVISQNETTVAAYPQLDAELARLDRELKKEPSNPLLLTERGELKPAPASLASASDPDRG